MSNEEITLREFGESLRKARTSQSRSLEDLASYTKIHRRHLEAIEAGNISQLPQGPYIKAFLREYARALGLSVPAIFASPVTPADPPRGDSKAASQSPPEAQEEGALPISAVAKETARFANTAVKSAVKTVTKTTESMVNLVETGGKEALEVLTSKSLWEEAEGVRRERLGLTPLAKRVEEYEAEEKKQEIEKLSKAGTLLGAPKTFSETPEARSAETIPIPAASRFGKSVDDDLSTNIQTASQEDRPVSSKGATNVVIALLLLLFGVAAFLAIRMYKRESGNPALVSKDYVPAPVEKTQPLTPPKREPPPVSQSVSPAVSSTDSLQFTLHATQPVWVSIAPDGLPAYRGEMKAGDFKSFRAGEKFVVNIGNQKSVDMQLNGQRLSNLPAIQNSGVVVRDLVLMRDRVTLGGTSVEVKKLTTPPASTPVVSEAPAVNQPVVPAGHSTVPPAKSTADKKPSVSQNGAAILKGVSQSQKNGQGSSKVLSTKSPLSTKPGNVQKRPKKTSPIEISTVEPILPKP